MILFNDEHCVLNDAYILGERARTSRTVLPAASSTALEERNDAAEKPGAQRQRDTKSHCARHESTLTFLEARLEFCYK